MIPDSGRSGTLETRLRLERRSEILRAIEAGAFHPDDRLTGQGLPVPGPLLGVECTTVVLMS